ncbi:hypothetical protein NC796_16665 [Aliifodinibius sp. S!AR15-10]|uniref:hypothetical protein n=1 Tax=Aliifodinibius sp. S!AR15-10 TaxID=2950437 RepID=UPI002862F097|nr:hypothetical protein [Aliifodinibius sp. S!AR15-10]MDR8392790.1 hypothetical protein [Aliifodinibius sp. S!AR15-10]
MTLEAFSIKWFTIYYTVFGLLSLLAGGWLLLAPSQFKSYLVQEAENEAPPQLLRTILKYWFLFTLPCLVLSFFPFSWSELLFSAWSLLMVYTIGAQLVRWPNLRIIIQQHPDVLSRYVRLTGVILLSAAVVILLLAYLKILAITRVV